MPAGADPANGNVRERMATNNCAALATAISGFSSNASHADAEKQDPKHIRRAAIFFDSVTRFRNLAAGGKT
jgi:hypothetical protein